MARASVIAEVLLVGAALFAALFLLTGESELAPSDKVMKWTKFAGLAANSNSTPMTQLRFLHSVYGASNVDVYAIDNGTSYDLGKDLAYAKKTDYTPVIAGHEIEIKVYKVGENASNTSIAPILTHKFTPEHGPNHPATTAVVSGLMNNGTSVAHWDVYTDYDATEKHPVPSNISVVRFIHLAYGVGDLELLEEKDAAMLVKLLVGANHSSLGQLKYRGASKYFEMPAPATPILSGEDTVKGNATEVFKITPSLKGGVPATILIEGIEGKVTATLVEDYNGASTPPGDESSSKWWVWLLVILGILLVVGIAFYCYRQSNRSSYLDLESGKQ